VTRAPAQAPARLLIVLLACLVLPALARAQVRQPGAALSAGEGSGTLSDVSTNVGHDSRPMHGGPTVGESSGGPIGSDPVSDARTRSMLSGPVSSISSGPMRAPRAPLSGGSVSAASAGAVKHDSSSPLGTRISDPLRELSALQEQMRARREQAEHAALVGATEPAAPAVAELSLPLEIPAPEPAPPGEREAVQGEAELEAEAAVDAPSLP
jgi:hypothetical protein